MEIINIKINELKEYENNPRNNDSAVEAVANSIKEFGFKVPIVIDSTNTIVCGHTRIRAAKMLGLTSVPCIVADDLTEEQIKAFRLADNKVSELAFWDFEKLNQELEHLDIDMNQFGFDAIEEEFDIAEKEESTQEDLKVSVNVECRDLLEAEELYQRLSNEGYKCKLK